MKRDPLVRSPFDFEVHYLLLYGTNGVSIKSKLIVGTFISFLSFFTMEFLSGATCASQGSLPSGQALSSVMGRGVFT